MQAASCLLLRAARLVAPAAVFAFVALAAGPPAKVLLRENWRIQSSADVAAGGAQISQPAFSTRGWYPATLPSTVFSALVAARVYPDPYTGMNLRTVAGTTYPIGTNFSNTAMPPESPFRRSWWFRTTFKLAPEQRTKTLWLGFDGINFRANVWLNGKQIAAADRLAGAWRVFSFDVTAAVRAEGDNALAVEVFPPQPEDLAITFVDWNPMPADKGVGLWRDVHLTTSGPAALRFPTVTSRLDANGRALLTITAEVSNPGTRPVDAVLKGAIEKLTFSQPVRLAPRETRTVRFTPESHPQLTIASPRLWWPVFAGEQNLYPLDLSLEAGGAVSDARSLRFGIREVTSELDAAGKRLFRVNGKKILVRGAGYTFDMLLRSSPAQQEAQLRYVRDMNLNAVRLEGKMEDEHFYELCDRLGILVMAGWCCCDHWEKWKDWDAEDEVVAAASLRDQLRLMMPHPSVFTWLNGSDNPPPAKIEQMYLDVIREVGWANPYQSSATAKPTSLTGATGFKMTGPYDWVPPSYWLTDRKFGGAHGFNSETSPGPTPPPIESLRRMLPADHLWPIDSWWDYHAGGGAFKDIRIFTAAQDARYGKSSSAEEFARKAQINAYEAERAMFEAFGRNKFASTGVIQWMLNNAWPGMIWHLYDWYLRPGGSYFGAKLANEPLHVQYSYDDRSVAIVNSYLRPFAGLKVAVRVYNLDMSVKSSREAVVDVEENSSTRAFTLPEIDGLSATYFVHLTLTEQSGKLASRNFYWLSTAPETLDWNRSNWYYTPVRTFADFTALDRLPRVELQAKVRFADRGQERAATVTLVNPSRSLAFGVRLKLNRADGEEILPVLWEDNYFALLPGETREITALAARGGATVEVEGWNVKSTTVKP